MWQQLLVLGKLKLTQAKRAVDDHAMVREGLRSLLESYEDVHVVGEARNGREAVAIAAELGAAMLITKEAAGERSVRRSETALEARQRCRRPLA